MAEAHGAALRGIEAELRIVVAAGIVSRADADALREAARRQKARPLVLLRERGTLSEQSFASLCAQVPDGGSLHEDEGIGETLTGEPGDEECGSDDLAFPVPGWDRYQNFRFLGRGGMGRVFLVRDPRLRRNVAIKFVRGDDHAHVKRLIAEARAQALVSHPRVCKVHEVGEVEGKVYIAMQYIEGKSLGAMAGELTLEQMVRLVREAAEGIHEAHRAGIIHRDIKPSNIMVERNADGELGAYVMDFGLARSVHDEGVTLSGTVLGTPRYMAPEQARGQISALDRRADVYGLGATLYHLVTGQPPVAGEGVIEVLHNLATRESPRPRTVNPDVPVDLEAILLKCLEHDRSDRYDSARALADDLGRFLDGDAVQARAAGAWYRLRKHVVKHRRLVVAGTAALVLCGVAVGSALRASHQADERERLARRFTEKLEAIESTARYAAQAPRHDLRPDHAALRLQMLVLRLEIRGGGELAAGPGRYALGRGYLALGDDVAARKELEAAWQLGFREPRVALALALALGHLYHQRLLAAAARAPTRGPTENEAKARAVQETERRELEQLFRAPAQRYLRASGGASSPSLAHVPALMAFYAGDLDAALRELEAVGPARPWSYEAAELRGDILLARAFERRDRREYAQARLDLAASRAAYTAAVDIGRSALSVYRSLATLEYATMTLDMYAMGDPEGSFARGIAATSHALVLMPDDYDALALEARFHRSLAEYRSARGSEAMALLDTALARAQRALVIDPAGPRARQELAEIYRQRGEVLQHQHLDPGAELDQAVRALESIPVATRAAVDHANLGLIYKVWADYEDSTGKPSELHRRDAIGAFRSAIQLDPELLPAWSNLGSSYYMRAMLPPHREDDLHAAIEALTQAKRLDADNVVPYFYIGEAYRLIAERKRLHGDKPEEAINLAIAAYDQGRKVNSTLPHLANGLGLTAMVEAAELLDTGKDPESAFARAHAAFAQGVACEPSYAYSYWNLGELSLVRARLAHERGRDPRALAHAAIQQLEKAIERISDSAEFWATLGAAHALLADDDLERGVDPEPRVREATGAANTAITKNPREARAYTVLGDSRTTLARFRARRGLSAGFHEAEAAYLNAIKLSPDAPDHALALGQLYERWAEAWQARGLDPAPVLTKARPFADQLLKARSRWPSALVLRASLTLVAAETTNDHAQRRALAEQSAADFAAALAVRTDLRPRWERRAAVARRLAGRSP